MNNLKYKMSIENVLVLVTWIACANNMLSQVLVCIH